LTFDAREPWSDLVNELVRDQNREDFPPMLRGPWAKLKVYAARLALTLHLLRWVTGGTKEKNVDRESVVRAGLLVRCFHSHTRKVFAVIGADPEVEDAKRVLQWIERERPSEFKRYEVFEDVKCQRFSRIEDLDKPIARLMKHGMIRRRQVRRGKGRPPDPVFEVNPLIYGDHPKNPKNPKNAARN
jgi:hypothetical protein